MTNGKQSVFGYLISDRAYEKISIPEYLDWRMEAGQKLLDSKKVDSTVKIAFMQKLDYEADIMACLVFSLSIDVISPFYYKGKFKSFYRDGVILYVGLSSRIPKLSGVGDEDEGIVVPATWFFNNNTNKKVELNIEFRRRPKDWENVRKKIKH